MVSDMNMDMNRIDDSGYDGEMMVTLLWTDEPASVSQYTYSHQESLAAQLQPSAVRVENEVDLPLYCRYAGWG